MTFHEFASAWFAARRLELRPRTQTDYLWRLSNHLLPHFKDFALSDITVESIDRYRASKVEEAEKMRARRANGERVRPLSAGSINKTISLLAAILESAVEYGHLASNPARGKRRRLKPSEPKRSYLQADQAQDLLAAGGELDAESADAGWRYPLLATLVLAGLRIGETLDLRWRDVDLSGGGLSVADSKTAAGVRRVTLTPALREALSEYRARAPSGPDDSCSAPTTDAASRRATSATVFSLARSRARM